MFIVNAGQSGDPKEITANDGIRAAEKAEAVYGFSGGR